eukprot:CAMPEP_0176222370 /NCGR_PEP_ID=MMETSP0121_2-20121125/20200_1 /TAXON_ID=160619 /ORGANISM="Kryptoperidinium foliaceum, Strain CCMP 1326" /LENGTH=129 /DNA_ID=CAMNT_0017561583 /DNA_START=302 /DNA_END=688 /DNA_ORIENTATION=-
MAGSLTSDLAVGGPIEDDGQPMLEVVGVVNRPITPPLRLHLLARQHVRRNVARRHREVQQAAVFVAPAGEERPGIGRQRAHPQSAADQERAGHDAAKTADAARIAAGGWRGEGTSEVGDGVRATRYTER